MWGLLSILSLHSNEFINSILQEHKCNILFIIWYENYFEIKILGVKMFRLYRQLCYGHHPIMLLNILTTCGLSILIHSFISSPMWLYLINHIYTTTWMDFLFQINSKSQGQFHKTIQRLLKFIISHYTTLTNFSMKYLTMCKVYTDVGGIK